MTPPHPPLARDPRARYRLSIALVLALAPGCGGDGGDGSGARGGSTAAVPPLRIERVAVVDGHHIEFGRIEAVTAGADGRIYVADTPALEVVVLNPDGSRAGVIGGRGEGPGEFMGLTGSLAWSGDALVTVDWRQFRVSLFEPSGGVVATRSWTVGEVPRPTRLFTGGREAYGLATVPRAAQPLPSGQPGPRPPPEPAYMAISGDGSFRPLPALEHDLLWPLGLDCSSRDGWIRLLSIPYRDRGPLQAFLPGGELAVARHDRYRIDMLDPVSGEVVRTIERDMPPIPLGEDDWESQPEMQELRRYEQESGGALEAAPGGGPCPLPELRPEHFPVLRTLVSDEEGRLWVEATSREGFLLALFAPDGTFLGEAPMPARDPRVPPFARRGRLYLVTVDDLGVQGIEVYEVAPIR